MSKLIVANWKMHGSLNKINDDLGVYLSHYGTNKPNIVFALPNVYIAYAQKIFKSKFAKCKLASQDLSIHKGFGAYTGEISGDILVDCGVTYAIVGHSERRAFGDTNEIVVQKLNSAIVVGITPILCIGESFELRQSKGYLDFLQQELDCLNQVVTNDGFVIAYEPIWAIGTNLIPTIQQIEEVANFIREYVSEKTANLKLSILYGGSVNSSNANDIMEVPGIDGVLVGGASLKVHEFTQICNVANIYG